MVDWHIEEYGTISYQEGLDEQFAFLEKAKSGEDHYFMLLEHERVITLGRRTESSHLLFDIDQLEELNIELFKVDRGGSATYHGPGQLVGYLICKASRMGGIHQLVTKVLNFLQEVVSSYGIDCAVDFENPGIWTTTNPPRKLAAVGMQNVGGYTLHGFALNVHLSLTGFQLIVPCGLDYPVSTMSIELGTILRLGNVRDRIKSKFMQNFVNNKILQEH